MQDQYSVNLSIANPAPYQSSRSSEFRCRYCDAAFKRIIALRSHICNNHPKHTHTFTPNDDIHSQSDVDTEESDSDSGYDQDTDEVSLFSNQTETSDSNSSNASSYDSEIQETESTTEHSLSPNTLDLILAPKNDSNAKKRKGTETGNDDPIVSQYTMDNEPPTKKRKLDANILIMDIPFIVTADLESIFESTESEGEIENVEQEQDRTEVNRQSIIEWKEILNGDPNHNKPLVTNRNTKDKWTGCKEDDKCATCHTYSAKQDGQCESCQSNKLGMPFCTNCDTRLSYDDYRTWLKEYGIDEREESISEVSKYVVLCQTCFICCKEFL